MSSLRADDVCRDLCEFLASQVLGGTGRLSDETPLADAGIDSFALMETVLYVERRYGIVVPVERLTREHVRTVRSLGLCVASLAAG